MKTRFPFLPFKAAAGMGLLAIAVSGPVQAQAPPNAIAAPTVPNAQNIAPKQPKSQGPGRIVNEAEPKPISGHGDNEVLVKKLKGVFILSNPKAVRKQGVSGHPGVDPGNVAFAKLPSFDAAVAPYLGKPVTMTSLAELTRSIVAFYRDHDRPVVNVYVPEQSITSGYVQVVVVESKIEKIDATGAHYFSNNFLKSELSLRPEEPISGSTMRNDLSWINRNPFLQSDILLAPGDAPGTTDVLLRTQDRRPYRIYGGYENSGNQFTGYNRLLAGFNYGNVFGVGQQASFQFTTSPNINQFYAYSGNYIIPLPWKHQLTFFGNYSATNANFGSGITSGGVNWQVSTRYEIPLPSTPHFTESITGGFDFKRTDNSYAFGIIPLGPNAVADTDQFVMSYQGLYVDDFGSTAGSASVYLSPGGITNYNNDAAYALQRTGALAEYAYEQYALTRITNLPAGFTWTLRGLLQVSNENLLPSEELGLGGYQTVRGYQEREVNGDHGFLFSNEVATPPVSIAALFGNKALKDQLQFLAFIDYGGTGVYQQTPDNPNPSSNLLGVGPGVRYNIAPYLAVRFDYGFQLINTNLGNGQHSRGDVGVILSF